MKIRAKILLVLVLMGLSGMICTEAFAADEDFPVILDSVVSTGFNE